MVELVAIQEWISKREEWNIIDVRSPGEYQAGHIPGASNIPLFSDEERAVIGTLYTQVSPEVAFNQGLHIAGLKMKDLVEAITPYKQNGHKRILIHCWRGGKRSEAIQWLYSFAGVECSRLAGGYKSYRTAAHSFFEHNPFELNLIGGCTGAGKTEVLQALADRGEQIIDLEKLAHHKGSAFGSIGELEQPTTEQFENDLYLTFLAFDPNKPVWIENESKSIGKAQLPDGLWNQMKASMLYNLDVPKEMRLSRILKYYCEPVEIEKLKCSFEKIEKRLGGLDFQIAMKALDHHDLETAASIALKYYDKAYAFQWSSWPTERLVYLDDCSDVEKTAERLVKSMKEKRHARGIVVKNEHEFGVKGKG